MGLALWRPGHIGKCGCLVTSRQAEVVAVVPVLKEEGAAQRDLRRKQEPRPPAWSSTTPVGFRPSLRPSKLLPLSWPLPCLPRAEVSSTLLGLVSPRSETGYGAVALRVLGPGVPWACPGPPVPILTSQVWFWALNEVLHQRPAQSRRYFLGGWDGKPLGSLLSGSCPTDKGRTSCPQRPSSLHFPLPPRSQRS